MLRYNIGLSLNAIVVTSFDIPWTTVELIYVIPPVHSGEQWVLYNPDLIDREIQGHTSPTTGKNVDSHVAEQEVPAHSGRDDCGWRKCPNCKAFNPKGFTSCLNCRVCFTFEPIMKVNKVAQRVGGKGDNAGTSPVIQNHPTVVEMTKDRAMQESIGIAKAQVRSDKDLEQRFVRPGDHLWEVVNGNMKWRIRFDAMPFDEQQTFIADGKSRFCAGDKFERQSFDFHHRPPIPLEYGGAEEFLVSQAEHLSLRSRRDNETAWILHGKIYIAGVLADGIEAA